nr:o-succinylbenzoate--CoA ligase [Ardenticatena sp.]
MPPLLRPPTDWLAERAARTPSRAALIWREQVWTYGELHSAVNQLAAQLRTAGVEAGARVATLLPNSPAAVMVLHAVLRVGATLVPLNTRLTTAELAWQIARTTPALLVYNHATASQAEPLGNEVPLFDVDTPPERTSVAETFTPLPFDGVQAIVFTSGTTGRPKGAMLTLANHFWSATASAWRLGVQRNDCWLLCMPLYHVGGMAILLRSALYGTAVCLHERFDTDAVLQALDSGSVTLVSVVPTMLKRLLDAHGDRPFHSAVRTVLVGGAATPPALLERALSAGIPVALTYGLTEAASQVATAAPDEVRALPGTVGAPLWGTTVRIVRDDGTLAAAGEVGEIVVRGPTVMRGYWRDPDATAHTLRDGWLHTGDMGYLDDAGRLWMMQRRTDLIVSGGENVYPSEVEGVLLRHPAVEAVCVVGMPDAEWGEVVTAVIQPREKAACDVDDIRAFCRRHLAGYKCPKRIVVVEALPLTASGKIARQIVKERLVSGRDGW